MLTRLMAVALIVSAVGDAFAAPDPGFSAFVASLRPEAEAAGVSRNAFDTLTRGLEPNFKLPDLALPGRPATGAPAQAEFVQVPADYVKEDRIARLAADGRARLQTHRAALDRIARDSGVPAPIVLAIWGRETDYGRYKLAYDGLQALATQAYAGRRKDQYRGEFIAALKLIARGDVTRADLRTSWAGATGLVQFLPSEIETHGVDGDGDGRVDLWHSVPDALASAARQLVAKGWKPGVRWAYEVRPLRNGDCTQGVPDVTRSIGDWIRMGYAPARGETLSAIERAEPASLVQPEGRDGPSFLATKNYFVIKEYNVSDLYVLFVGHLADRIIDPRPFATPWRTTRQMRTADVEELQRGMTRLGLYRDTIDGKAGMKTRAAVGAVQKRAGLDVDCWPSDAALQATRTLK